MTIIKVQAFTVNTNEEYDYFGDETGTSDFYVVHDTLQKYLGLNTYVPPHPKDDKEMWGSTKGWEMGTEKNALSFVSKNIQLMEVYHSELVSNGFKLICHG